jgi:AmpD protein
MHKRAWHAGVSRFQERENCNDFSISIELEGSDDDDFLDLQYETLSKLIQFLKQEYQIPIDNIVGHSDISPGRKTDPGPHFKWDLIRSSL